MTPAKLAEVRACCAELLAMASVGTPGPWEQDARHETVGSREVIPWTTVAWDVRLKDRVLICAARNTLRASVEIVLALLDQYENTFHHGCASVYLNPSTGQRYDCNCRMGAALGAFLADCHAAGIGAKR